MFGLFKAFKHKAEIRESQDEMLVGEIVRIMARRGWPSIFFRATGDYQRVRFMTPSDPMLHSVYITLDRKTGTGALSEAVFGSKATLRIAAEIKNYITDPDDLLAMYKTDLANLFKLSYGSIKLNHELNSVYATTFKVIDISKFVGKGDKGLTKLQKHLESNIASLREKLAPYKKG